MLITLVILSLPIWYQSPVVSRYTRCCPAAFRSTLSRSVLDPRILVLIPTVPAPCSLVPHPRCCLAAFRGLDLGFGLRIPKQKCLQIAHNYFMTFITLFSNRFVLFWRRRSLSLRRRLFCPFSGANRTMFNSNQVGQSK